MMGLEAETLAAHNAYRAMHGAPPLVWSAECAFSAQVLCWLTPSLLSASHCAHYSHWLSTLTGSLLSLALLSHWPVSLCAPLTALLPTVLLSFCAPLTALAPASPRSLHSSLTVLFPQCTRSGLTTLRCVQAQADKCQEEGRLHHGNLEGISGKHGARTQLTHTLTCLQSAVVQSMPRGLWALHSPALTCYK